MSADNSAEIATAPAAEISSSIRNVEEWRPIPGADGFYSVSNHGLVRSEPLPYRTLGRKRGRILKPSCDTKGYPFFHLMVPGNPVKNLKVHRAVAAAFLGVAGPKMQVNHKNGIKSDNRVENLEYVTCRDNIRHCWESGLHGTDHCKGSANKQAKLKEEDVRSIRQLYPNFSLNQLASRFHVTATTISYIIQRKTWQHV